MIALLISTHSLVDVITNSSSELFVCDSDKSAEFVKDFLIDSLYRYNLENSSSKAFDDCFGEILKVDESNFDEFFNEYIVDWDYSNWKWKGEGIDELITQYKWEREYRKDNGLEYKPWNDKANEKFNNKIDKQVSKAWNAYLDEWKKGNYEKVKAMSIGQILIKSVEDNSIPYDMFDTIESAFKADRIHLG